MRPVRPLSLLTTLLLLAACSDLPELADADLQAYALRVPDSENGALELTDAGALLDEEFDAGRARKLARDREPWDEDFARDVLARNEEALAGLDRALAATYFQVAPETLADEPVPSAVERWVGLPSLAALRVAQERRGGRPEAALAGAFTIVLLGHRIESGSSQLLPMMLGLAFRRAGLEQVQRILPELALERDSARALVALLETTRGGPENWIRAWAGEYQVLYRLFDESVAPEATTGTFQMNRTMTILAEYYRGLRENAGRPCSEMVPPPRPPDFSDMGVLEKVSFMARPNVVGRILAQISLADHHRYELRGCLTQSHVSSLQVLAALRAYQAERGSLPDSLDALVPEWLEHVPADEFDGQPIRYSSERRVLYSVGEDFVDDGGTGDPAQGFAEITGEPTLAISF